MRKAIRSRGGLIPKKKVVKFKTKKTDKYRSGFEREVSLVLTALRETFLYEDKGSVIEYVKPETKHKYNPDWVLSNGIILETKGQWTLEDRKKIRLVVSQNPDKDIRMVFQRPHTRLSAASQTTYAQYCDKHGIRWGTKADIENWINE